MGLFDQLSPGLAWLDSNALGFLPPAARLLVWAAISGFISMWLYRLTSNQQRIAELKDKLRQSQKSLSDYDDDDFSELFALMRESLGLAFRRLGQTLGPALLASLPLIFILAWASNTFDRLTPAVGEQIRFALVPTGSDAGLDEMAMWRNTVPVAAVEGQNVAHSTAQRIAQSIAWPSPQEHVTLRSPAGEILLNLPLAEPVPVVHRKRWWNSLIGNAAGYLPEQDELDAITFDLPRQQYIGFGPEWMRGWLCLFFVGVLVFSLIVKVVFKIH